MPHFDGPHRWHCDLFFMEQFWKASFSICSFLLPNSTSTSTRAQSPEPRALLQLRLRTPKIRDRDLDAWQIYRLQRVTSSRMPMLQLCRSFHQADILTDNSYVHLKNFLTDRRISMMTCGIMWTSVEPLALVVQYRQK